MRGNNSFYLSTVIPDSLKSSEYTVECLVYVTSNTSSPSDDGGRSCVISKGTSNGYGSSWHIGFGGNLVRVDMWDQGTGDITINLNQWNHIMMTIDNGIKYTFINGDLVYHGPSTDYSDNNLYIGYETMYGSYIKDWCYVNSVKVSNISRFQSSVNLSYNMFSLFDSNNIIYGIKNTDSDA